MFATSGCAQAPPKDPDLAINLRWVRNYPKEHRSNVDTGLYWALSFLGAKLPASANVLSWHGKTLMLDLGAAQVQDGTQEAWKKLLREFKASEEYRKTGAIDIGRFVFVSLCSANLYYELSGTSQTYPLFLARHTFAPRQIAIVQSAVAHGNRLIEVGAGPGIGNVAFVAFEGSGALKDATFRKEDIETLEFMQNGQLRFGVYDLDGHLKDATTPALTTAGKPSKCLWCHEINLNRPFNNVTDLPGYYTTQQFRDLLTSQMRVVASYRQTLRSKVDFRKTQDHSNAENLYLSFAHPTAERLADEWQLPLATVRQMLQRRQLKTHPHSDYVDDRILGDELYDRDEVAALAPYSGVRGPSDIREASSHEPAPL
ncbi:MAG TPA: hypothetical protein VGV09_01100 [Steroidobacteraceae bacterium]|nr:hypothetical protein [Steroidobacteraceae bacterium]